MGIHLRFHPDRQKIKKESRERVGKQMAYLKGYFAGSGLFRSIQALSIAQKVHNGERKGGQPGISHQLELVSYGLPLFESWDRDSLDILCSSLLLHDAVEDCEDESLLQEVHAFLDRFPDIKSIVLGVTKPQNFAKDEVHYRHYYSRIQIAGPWAIIVKMIDRLHNIESMLEVPEIFDLKKREKYIAEVREYMIPVAKELRREEQRFYQAITFLIRELKTYGNFIDRINLLDRALIEYGEKV